MKFSQSKKMMNKTSCFAILMLLCLAQSHIINASLQSFKALHNYPQKQLIYNSHSFQEGNLVYAVCDVAAKEKNCTIVQARYPDGKFQRSCNITLDVYQENAKFSDKIYVIAFGHDNAILFWDEVGPTTFFKLSTINMADCQIGGIALPDPSMEIFDQLRFNNKIVTYDDTLEIFIKSRNLPEGANDTESVITVNLRGMVQKSATEFMKIGKSSVTSISPIGKNSSGKSYVYSKDVDDKHALVIHKADGSEKVLATYNYNLPSFTSMANDLITLCVKSSVTCTQYDKEGNIKFNITLHDGDLEEETAARDLYNLPGGGFLIVLSKYDKTDDGEVDFGKVVDFSVLKINHEGKTEGSIHLNELVEADNSAKNAAGTFVWKNGNEEYCVAVLGQGINETNPADEPSDLNVVVNCFKEADVAI